MATADDSGAAGEFLIDRYLPRYDVTLVEHVVVDADLPTTWRAVLDLDLGQVHTPLLDAAFFVRSLPARAATALGNKRPVPPPPEELRLGGDVLPIEGWLVLGRTEQREVAFGAVGRFWQPEIEWYDVLAMSPEEFAAFDAPGWGRIAANFTVLRYGATRTLVSYEARTATADDESARKFTRYWRLIRPFAGHVMRAALAEVRRTAEEDFAALKRSAQRP